MSNLRRQRKTRNTKNEVAECKLPNPMQVRKKYIKTVLVLFVFSDGDCFIEMYFLKSFQHHSFLP